MGIDPFDPGPSRGNRDLVLARAASRDDCEADAATHGGGGPGGGGGGVGAGGGGDVWCSRPTNSVTFGPGLACSPADGAWSRTMPSSAGSCVDVSRIDTFQPSFSS